MWRYHAMPMLKLGYRSSAFCLLKNRQSMAVGRRGDFTARTCEIINLANAISFFKSTRHYD